MDKPKKNIMLLNWSNFSTELVQDMQDILKHACSIIVKYEEAITLEFHSTYVDWDIKEEEDLIEWSEMMLKKYPKYKLIPSQLKNGKIICYIAKNINPRK